MLMTIINRDLIFSAAFAFRLIFIFFSLTPHVTPNVFFLPCMVVREAHENVFIIRRA